MIGNVENGDDVLAVTEQADLDELADSFRIVGLWLPLDELVANTYRVRVHHGDDATGIIVRGGNRVRAGTLWHANIDPAFLGTVKSLIRKRGGHMPDWKSMVGLRDGDE